MSVTDELLENAALYADSFDRGELPLPPAKGVAVVACMDARLNVYGLLGLAEGDAHVIRNAGGVITDDEIRSLAISQRLLGTREVVLIHHTDCGMLTFGDDEFRRQVQQDTGIKPEWAAEAFDDLEDRRAAVGRAHQGEPVHPAQGERARLRLRREEREPDRGQVNALTARATIKPKSASATVDCTSMMYLARRVSGQRRTATFSAMRRTRAAAGGQRESPNVPKPSSGLEPETPSLPWRCSTN